MCYGHVFQWVFLSSGRGVYLAALLAWPRGPPTAHADCEPFGYHPRKPAIQVRRSPTIPKRDVIQTCIITCSAFLRIHTMNSLFSLVRCFLPTLACIVAVGCSSARVYQTSGTTASVGAVSDVQVALKPGALDAGAATDYRANSMSGAIRSALLAELRHKEKIAAEGATVEITVTDFRLRSGSAVFWVGVMAGDDRFAGTVTVKNGATILKTFDASAKGNESAWSGMALGRVSAGSRADVFCRMIARDIANQL